MYSDSSGITSGYKEVEVTVTTLSIEEVITGIDQCAKTNLFVNALRYLEEYRDSRKILKDDQIIGYWGKTPVTKIDGKYFAIGRYLPNEQAWRCSRVHWSDITRDYTPYDDEDYIIDNNREILFVETGWERRRIPYERV